MKHNNVAYLYLNFEGALVLYSKHASGSHVMTDFNRSDCKHAVTSFLFDPIRFRSEDDTKQFYNLKL